MNVRTLRARWIAPIAFAVSCAVVLAAIPGRREAVRTAEEAYIPLRPLTAEEAAFLIGKGAPVLEIDGPDAIFTTSSYVVREADGSFRAESASWENYRSVYRVRRDALEAALGRPVQPDRSKELRARVSFSSDHVPWYVAVEIVFLTVWLTALVLALRRIRRISAVLPLLWAFLAVPIFFVPVYAPAFVDADFFHQRVVLETMALWGLIAGIYLTVPAGVSLIVWIVLALVGRFAPGARRYAVAALLLAGCGLAGFFYGAWHVEASRCEADLEVAFGRIQRSGWLPAFERNRDAFGGNLFSECCVAPEVRRAGAAVLSAQGEDPRRELIVTVNDFGRGGDYLFLWRNSFLYADVRPMGLDYGPDYDHLTDGDALASAQRLGRYATGFRRAFSEGHVCARSTKMNGHDVVVAVRGEASRASAIFAW